MKIVICKVNRAGKKEPYMEVDIKKPYKDSYMIVTHSEISEETEALKQAIKQKLQALL